MPSRLLIDTFQSSGIEQHAMPTPAKLIPDALRTGTRPLFVAGLSRLVVVDLPLPGVDGSLLWTERIRRWWGNLPEPVDNLLHHGFTEMVNNANDHAGAHRLQLRCAATPDALHLWISDDGVGIFEPTGWLTGAYGWLMACRHSSASMTTLTPCALALRFSGACRVLPRTRCAG